MSVILSQTLMSVAKNLIQRRFLGYGNKMQAESQKNSNYTKRFSFLNFNLFLIGTLFLLVALISYNFNLVFKRSEALNKDLSEYKEIFLKKQKTLSDLQLTNSRIRSILFLHLLADQDKIMNAYQDEYRRLTVQNAYGFNELSTLLTAPEEVQFLADLNRARARVFSQREYFLGLSQKHQKEEAKVYFRRALNYAFNLYTSQLQNLCDYTDQTSMSNYDIIEERTSENLANVRKTIAAGFAAILIFVLLVWRITNKLRRDNIQLNELVIVKEKAQNDIIKLNEELESKVIERTKELESAHFELTQQIAAVNSSAIVSETDGSGTITFVNDLFCTVSGYRREELIGKNHRILKSGKQPDDIFINMWATITQGLVWKGLIQNRNKLGGNYWVDSTIMPFKNAEGEIIKYVAIRFEVTKQIEQQIALQEQADELSAQSEELRVQQEELHEANIVLSSQTQKLTASEEELKMQHEELMHSNTELEEKNQLIEERNFLINKKNTELNIIAKELEKKAEELTLSSKYKSEFLANMSHELRTPLNSILLLSKLLADNNDGNLDADQIEYAQVINNSGNGLLELINEILDLSKIEAGKMDVNKENIPISYLCKGADNIFKPLAKNKGIEFISSIINPVSEDILTDRIRVEQVLKNLISNAIKFTEKGKVELKVYAVSSEIINAMHLPANDYIAFEVTDSGIGIPPDKLEHIFEAFQQADGSTQRKYGGTGLGLAISREIAHLLKGEIKLTSEVGKGSVFTFIIPAKETPEPSNNLNNEIELKSKATIADVDTCLSENVLAEIEEQVHESLNNAEKKANNGKEIYLTDKALNGKKVLIVDDDNRNIISLKAILKNQNINITTAENGRAALSALESNANFDLVLMDMMMPELDGYETVKELRKNSQWKNLPVIALTAKVMQGDREKCMEAGVSDYLTKPVSVDKLLSLLKVWLYK